MPTSHHNDSPYDNHYSAAELHDGAAHAHRVAERQGKEDRLTAHEHSRQALEHSQLAHHSTEAASAGHGVTTFGHAEIAALAHELWVARGCPEGTPEEDWFHAVAQLRSRAHTG